MTLFRSYWVWHSKIHYERYRIASCRQLLSFAAQRLDSQLSCLAFLALSSLFAIISTALGRFEYIVTGTQIWFLSILAQLFAAALYIRFFAVIVAKSHAPTRAILKWCDRLTVAVAILIFLLTVTMAELYALSDGGVMFAIQVIEAVWIAGDIIFLQVFAMSILNIAIRESQRANTEAKGATDARRSGAQNVEKKHTKNVKSSMRSKKSSKAALVLFVRTIISAP